MGLSQRSAGAGCRVAKGDLDTLANLLVSSRTGIIRRLVMQPYSGDEVRILHARPELPDYRVLPGGGAIALPGGSGFSITESTARVLFETVERYCASFIDEENQVWTRPSSDAFLFGDRFPLFADFQYQGKHWPFRRLGGDSLIWWTKGTSLFSGNPVHVPSALVFIPYCPSSPDEQLGPSISTGMASGWSWESACLSGLLEVCEREAFVVMWLNRLSMPRLKVDPGSQLGRDLRQALGFSAGQVTFVKLSNDFDVPTVLAVLHRCYLDRPLVTVGAASKSTFEAAARKAFAEAANGYCRLVSTMEQTDNAWKPAPDFSNVVDWEWHSLTYADPSLQENLHFMTASEEEQPMPQETKCMDGDETQGETLELLLRRLKGKFSEIAAVDLTTRELSELGVHVVKVMIPEAVPLAPDHRYPFLAHSRLYELPRLLGYRNHRTTVEDLNSFPHPFS
jgi:ribosomal protein S12 methylthiotransferase accessory factor